MARHAHTASGSTSISDDGAGPGQRVTGRESDVTQHDDRSVDRVAGDRRADTDARDKFGGLNLGAAFFGWLVAIAVAVLLTSIVGAVVTGVGSNASITQNDAERSAGTIGIAAAITLLVVLALAYYAGGYVAGRMSRFNGARQGVGVWAIGLVVTLVALALGAILGSEYNLLDRVNLPRIPISTDQAGWGGVITAVAVLAVTLGSAIIGGLVGHRYHNRVDRAAHR